MNPLLAPMPLPDGLDEIRYEETAPDIETMILRRGRTFWKEPYTLTDCYTVKRRVVSIFPYRTKAVRFLDRVKVEAKRREAFDRAFPRFSAASSRR